LELTLLEPLESDVSDRLEAVFPALEAEPATVFMLYLALVKQATESMLLLKPLMVTEWPWLVLVAGLG
jgi:hypothetical protein